MEFNSPVVEFVSTKVGKTIHFSPTSHGSKVFFCGVERTGVPNMILKYSGGQFLRDSNELREDEMDWTPIGKMESKFCPICAKKAKWANLPITFEEIVEYTYLQNKIRVCIDDQMETHYGQMEQAQSLEELNSITKKAEQEIEQLLTKIIQMGAINRRATNLFQYHEGELSSRKRAMSKRFE